MLSDERWPSNRSMNAAIGRPWHARANSVRTDSEATPCSIDSVRVVARSSGCMTIVGLTGPEVQDIAVANLFLALLGTGEL
jgi:hypothetical protein